MKKIITLLLSRRIITIVALIFQAWLLIFVLSQFDELSSYFYIFSDVLSVFIIIYLVNKETSASLKIPWIILIALIPLFGGVIYLLFGENKVSNKYRINDEFNSIRIKSLDIDDSRAFTKLGIEFPFHQGQVEYIRNYTTSNLYQNTKTTYLKLGEDVFEQMCIALKEAKEFIFIESFIVDKGYMLDTIIDILEDKVKEGVDVRFIYDDIGCITTLPASFYTVLNKKGIKTKVFNKFVPILSIVHNNRDHRKITVVDGKIAFNGGVNIADEYINKKVRFGHWKDTAIMLEGQAVNDFTLMFLKTWDSIGSSKTDYSKYLISDHDNINNGYVICYEDTPLDKESVGENVYMNIINQATDYLYITTPYLIIDYDLTMALCNAAKRGVDVRLITPHIPDKWYVHLISQSNYKILINAGVRIFEYTPGFIHAKSFVCDDLIGNVGTINLDYRSLVHHFECSTLMINTSAVQTIKEDFIDTQAKSMEVFSDYFSTKPLYLRMITVLLKLFSPLM